ncbi:hypothetical protein Bpfe_015060 [Biomphalaria pfeifferi]|uniref:Uncharacterized protein n=1 Tax=Biomphalaria pfeifferi TaxID=112525 RepID=A0AAD8FA04_BIOPF|nr:hypothetical protein Bpfe_015060 [Biomphalaria pfeifferi]
MTIASERLRGKRGLAVVPSKKINQLSIFGGSNCGGESHPFVALVSPLHPPPISQSWKKKVQALSKRFSDTDQWSFSWSAENFCHRFVREPSV